MATKSTDQQECEEKKEEGLELKYSLLGVTLNLNDKLASCQLRMPPVLPPGFTENGNDTVVFMDLLPSDKGWTHSLRLMKEIVHPNILHARLTHKNELQRLGAEGASDYWGLVEPYTDTVFEYLKMHLGIPSTVKSGMILLPTENLCSIVRQIVDGLEHLMVLGYYHGNFSLKRTYYLHEPNGNIYVKLAGFIKRSEKKTQCQKRDLLALGNELEQLSRVAKELSIAADVKKNGPQFDTYQIDDLIKNLKQVTEANLHQIYQKIKGHAFFWVREHRKKFFVYDVAVSMKEESKFRAQIEECEDLCSTSWDTNDYDGFLLKMNDYRRSINRKIYDGSSRWSFVKFVIGLYTHEHLLKNGPNDVDRTIMKRHPRLCVLLRNLLRIHDIEWM